MDHTVLPANTPHLHYTTAAAAVVVVISIVVIISKTRHTGEAYRPFADLSHFSLELISLEKYQEDRLIDTSSLHTIS